MSAEPETFSTSQNITKSQSDYSGRTAVQIAPALSARKKARQTAPIQMGLDALLSAERTDEHKMAPGGNTTTGQPAHHSQLTFDQAIARYEALTGFIQTITTLSTIQETGSLMERVASTARHALHASFAVVAMRIHHDWVLRSSGQAPKIRHALDNGARQFLDSALACPYTFRLRDLKSDPRSAVIELDRPELRSLLCSPIRINGSVTGLVIAFGKQDEDRFNDFDIFLVEKLAAHAAINLESCFLNQELRDGLKSTRLLYELSQQMSQAENLVDASWMIARTAFRLLPALRCGLVLYSLDGRSKEVEVSLPASERSATPPEAVIQQAMNGRQAISFHKGNGSACMVMPIQSHRLCYGALWFETDKIDLAMRKPQDEVQALVNQTAGAVERILLLRETRSQSRELEQANRTLRVQAGALERAITDLDGSYDQTIEALMRALDARDRETEDHSVRVTRMSVWLGEKLGLSTQEVKALKRGAMLHDLGKLGIRDEVLMKPDRLSEEEWLEMRKHPDKGVEIIREISPLSDAIPVIIGHQERWDGSGYPNQLKGEEIPLLARIFSVVDVYDALTSDRPYRMKQPKEEVLVYLENQAGILFDPEIVRQFARFMRTDPPPGEE